MAGKEVTTEYLMQDGRTENVINSASPQHLSFSCTTEKGGNGLEGGIKDQGWLQRGTEANISDNSYTIEVDFTLRGQPPPLHEKPHRPALVRFWESCFSDSTGLKKKKKCS